MAPTAPSKTGVQLMYGLMHLLVPTIAMFAVCVATATPSNKEVSAELFATSMIGGGLYSLTGLVNLGLLYFDRRISPEMACTNSIMPYSSLFFGPAIAYVHVAPLDFAISYGRWYCVPNFGWGVEWGLQLLCYAGSGVRAAAIMAASIGSYFIQYAFEDRKIGFVVAFLPQVIMSIVMCAYCFHCYRSPAAAHALCTWVSCCVFFLILNQWHGVVADAIGQSAATIAIQLCDCTQIHFSTRFFVTMFRTKYARDTAAVFAADGKSAPDSESAATSAAADRLVSSTATMQMAASPATTTAAQV